MDHCDQKDNPHEPPQTREERYSSVLVELRILGPQENMLFRPDPEIWLKKQRNMNSLAAVLFTTYFYSTEGGGTTLESATAINRSEMFP